MHTGAPNSTSTAVTTSTMLQPTAAPTAPYMTSPQGALRPPKPTVSMDATPVLIPLLSAVISCPILAFAIICALRYRAQRLRRKEHIKRLRGGMRSATLDIPNREKPSFFSRDSSSDNTSRQHGEGRRDSLDDGSAESPSDICRPLRNNNHVKFVTAAAILHVPGVPSPQNGRLRSGSRSASVTFFDEPSFLDIDPDYDEDDDDDDEDDEEYDNCADR